MLLLTELIIHVKKTILYLPEPEYIRYKQTDRQTGNNSYQLSPAFKLRLIQITIVYGSKKYM